MQMPPPDPDVLRRKAEIAAALSGRSCRATG